MHPKRASSPPLRWTTVAAISAHIGVAVTTLREWLKTGRVRAGQVQARHYTDERPRKGTRGVWRIYEPDLIDFLRRLRGGEVKLPESIWRKR